MYKHVSVLLEETVAGLNIKPDGIYVDATLGGGGHSKLILQHLGPNGKVIGIDQDEVSILYNQTQFANEQRMIIVKDNFANLAQILKTLNITKIDGIIYDLGVSSMQIDDPQRGFSYMVDTVLDMRMDQSLKLNAQEVVNTFSEQALSDIFFNFGEEKFSKKIAQQIVITRKEHPINTTFELNEIIKKAIPKKFFYKLKGHYAKRVYQALRIYINQELVVFKQSVAQAFDHLNVGGRICVISFHSLEDRICKNYFKSVSELQADLKQLPVVPQAFLPKAKIINHKAICPSNQELAHNSRSKSSKLRILERVSE